MENLKRSFCVYLPEAHGFTTGSNNGNYAEYIDFKIESGKYYIKYSTSGDGDISPHTDWAEVTAERYAKEIAQAGWCEARERKMLGLNAN